VGEDPASHSVSRLHSPGRPRGSTEVCHRDPLGPYHRSCEGQDRVGEFFAEIFGLSVKPGYFPQVQVNNSLTLDFADEREDSGGPGFDPRTGRSQHYAVHVGDAEFDAIVERVKAKGIPYGSEPHSHTNGGISTRRGGRGFYFEDPYGHLLEVMTVPETGS
jgi:catechol 2,3-dioxygenase-like lactoylglutathione lyase family enzyme